MFDIVQLAIKLPYAITFITLLSLLPILIGSRFSIITGTISYELYLVHRPFYGYINGDVWKALVFMLFSYLAAYLFNWCNKALLKS